MSDQIVIDRRFRGPPDSGNGGYTCGLVAARVDGPAEVTLRLPPPLEEPLTVAPADGGSVCVLEGDALVAEGVQRDYERLGIDVPEPVSVVDAERAAAGSQLHEHPEEHPFPTCFVCGPQRAPDDGLRILVGPVPGRSVAADTWTPAADLAGADGVVRPEFVWAALDCPTGFALLEAFGRRKVSLNQVTAHLIRPLPVGARWIVMGWPFAAEGRTLLGASAIFSESGELHALASAVLACAD